MTRFVLLLHECARGVPRTTHCDLMLEQNESLQTWAIAALPHEWRTLSDREASLQFATSSTVTVERLADHRLAYLDYEGPVSGDRGTVRQLDSGTYSNGRNPQTFGLEGKIIRGQIELRPLSGSNSWQLTFTPAPS